MAYKEKTPKSKKPTKEKSKTQVRIPTKVESKSKRTTIKVGIIIPSRSRTCTLRLNHMLYRRALGMQEESSKVRLEESYKKKIQRPRHPTKKEKNTKEKRDLQKEIFRPKRSLQKNFKSISETESKYLRETNPKVENIPVEIESKCLQETDSKCRNRT